MVVIGHRGAAGYEPENTLRSFKRAIDMGVDMIECDVHLCKTGELVVIHDAMVGRTTNGKGAVIEKTFDELRSLDAGSGEHIPNLREVLALIRGKAKINIELKGESTAVPVAKLLSAEIARGNWKNSDLSVSSFDLRELKSFHNEAPDIPVAAIVLHPPINLSRVLALGVYSLHACEKFVTKSFVARAHKAGLGVYAWTVNEPDQIAKMFELGIDGIFSDFPDMVRAKIN